MFSIFVQLAVLASFPTIFASNAKRGIAFAENNGDDVSKLGSQSSWLYAWSSTEPSYLSGSGKEFIPMQWGSGGAESFISTVQASGAKTILGFNEPDMSGQSNLDPTTAANIWIQYIQPLHNKGVRLGAPAVSAAPGGIQWLQSFINACSGCTIDFIPLHWYGDGSQYFEQYVNNFASTFPGKPLWVTEWASTNPSDSVTNQFLIDTVAFLDGNSIVERYSWFAFERDDGSANRWSLLNGDGSLNARGSSYL